jgi:asparaginyl-tRNA synthetase
MAFATHTFFNERGFLYVHTPLITASDCEGAGEQFHVTTMLPKVSVYDYGSAFHATFFSLLEVSEYTP